MTFTGTAVDNALEGRLDKLRAVGVDAVFAPTPRDMYPNGQPGPVGRILEGGAPPHAFCWGAHGGQ